MKSVLWIGFELMVNALQSGLVAYYLSSMFTVESKRRWALSLCAILFFISLTIYTFVDIPLLDTWIFLFPLLATSFACKESLLEKVFWILILMAAFSGVTTLSANLGLSILGINAELLLEQNAYRIFSVLLCNTILALVIFLLTRIKRKDLLSPTPSVIFSAIAFSCAILIDILFINYQGDNPHQALKFFGSILVIVVVLLTIILYVLMSKSTERELAATRRAAALQAESQRVEELQSVYDSLHGLRHDMNNHLRIVQSLVLNGHAQEGAEYIEKINGKLFSVFSTQCLALDSLLTLKELEMKQHRIRFAHDLCKCQKLSISDFELCSIVGNLLDNAIEAIERGNIPEEKRVIQLTISHVRGMLYIECKNPADQGLVHKKDGRFITSKSESGHGRGIQNITSIAHRVHGFASFECENNEFVAFTAFPFDKE